MPTPYASDDLGRVFDSKTLTRGRSLVLVGAVEVKLVGATLNGVVADAGAKRVVQATPALRGRRVVFDATCTCRNPACVHLAATLLCGLDRLPALRKPEQKSLFDSLSAPVAEVKQPRFEVAPGSKDFACYVTVSLISERTGRSEPSSPAAVLAMPKNSISVMSVAKMLGGNDTRTGVPATILPDLIPHLIRSGFARWLPSGKRLSDGEERTFPGNAPPKLPPKSAVLMGFTGPWYVDGSTGAVGRVRVRKIAALPGRTPVAPIRPAAREPVVVKALESDRAIIERPVVPIMRLRKLKCPDDFGKLQMLDALTIDFDYGGVVTSGDDERQFVPVAPDKTKSTGGPSFIRRNPAAEAAAFDSIKGDGFVQMRVADPSSPKGRRVFVYRGRDASEKWHQFVATRVPSLESLGFQSFIEGDFGPPIAVVANTFDVTVADAEAGRFSLDFGIEIDGVRRPLLPILSHLHARGGIDNAQIQGDDLITSLEDGRVVKLPAERIRRLLSIMGDLIENAGRALEESLELPAFEAPTVVELEEVLSMRWQDAGAIEAQVARYRNDAEISHVELPPSFTATLRPYQQHGVDWLQHLMRHDMGGFLADDMGLGKTAQTIAHIAVEHASKRLKHPVMIVVPTSLITNWTAEIAKFAPSLKTMVLHGLDRHARREEIDQYQVIITTYTVLTRDIEEMKALPWHMIVLDEAQAIKSPDAKATRAVCQLQAKQRICLSGTPIENNLEELWSQFAFLMPGLLGDRRSFVKRFRTPIEKRGDEFRRRQLMQRIKPFLTRRTKSEVATELPPKHTVLRRITLAPEQRELYETIRATMLEKVREQVAERSLAQSRIVVLDALLKLRQACCDPRLVKLSAAREIECSSKLDDLLEMITEMVPEGRKILLFSQFTSMLDLIKPRLDEAGIKFVELTGETRDRAEPVRAFQAGEVPVFIISLKAGGRGLNLTAADTVIHYDPWWNPAVEDQATDRAHRIGQTKSVFVYKLIAADTVEERILELQQRKAELAGIAFGEGSELSQLDFDDIDYLFGADPERKAA